MIVVPAFDSVWVLKAWRGTRAGESGRAALFHMPHWGAVMLAFIADLENGVSAEASAPTLLEFPASRAAAGGLRLYPLPTVIDGPALLMRAPISTRLEIHAAVRFCSRLLLGRGGN